MTLKGGTREAHYPVDLGSYARTIRSGTTILHGRVPSGRKGLDLAFSSNFCDPYLRPLDLLTREVTACFHDGLATPLSQPNFAWCTKLGNFLLGSLRPRL